VAGLVGQDWRGDIDGRCDALVKGLEQMGRMAGEDGGADGWRLNAQRVSASPRTSALICFLFHTKRGPDSAKVDRRGFTPIAPVEATDVLATDEDADPNEVANLRARGVDVRLT
jgi:hypothetical protein